MAKSVAKKPYHHGSLRPALLRAVAELIVEKGIEGLSLRECARRAGASWSAPAHHFGDKTGMLTAFAVAGFAQLKAHMEARRDASLGEAARALAVGEGYLEFALQNPGQYRVMFRAELLNKDDPDYHTASRAAFQVLEDAIRECEAAAGSVDETTLHERCLLAWCAVHGFATLCLEGAIDMPGRGAKARLRAGLELGGGLLRLLGPSLFGSAGPRPATSG
jgi:AcrR family transcriptional regulator